MQLAWFEQNITSRQYAEIIRKGRKNNVGKECLDIVKYFQQKQEGDESFYITMDLGDDGTLRSVFWGDGRVRAVYLQFCDILVFYVTYKTNKFKMPFAPLLMSTIICSLACSEGPC